MMGVREIDRSLEQWQLAVKDLAITPSSPGARRAPGTSRTRLGKLYCMDHRQMMSQPITDWPPCARVVSMRWLLPCSSPGNSRVAWRSLPGVGHVAGHPGQVLRAQGAPGCARSHQEGYARGALLPREGDLGFQEGPAVFVESSPEGRHVSFLSRWSPLAREPKRMVARGPT